MAIALGQEVELLGPWPMRPGGSLSLQPGDRGRVVRSTATHAAVEVVGAVIVVPVTLLRPLDGPVERAGGDIQDGDGWFDRWTTEMKKRRPPSDGDAQG
jgi:hypothetical protein